jgi:hypothetical protein
MRFANVANMLANQPIEPPLQIFNLLNAWSGEEVPSAGLTAVGDGTRSEIIDQHELMKPFDEWGYSCARHGDIIAIGERYRQNTPITMWITPISAKSPTFIQLTSDAKLSGGPKYTDPHLDDESPDNFSSVVAGPGHSFTIAEALVLTVDDHRNR